MKLITFEGIKKKYHLGQAQACGIIKQANYHQAESRKDTRTPRWRFKAAEIDMLVKRLKEKLERRKNE
jgi:hypothetical protein